MDEIAKNSYQRKKMEENKKRKIKVSEETKKVLEQARKPEFTEEEIDEGMRQTEI